jgi:GT2 family glycosyltransferase
LDVSIIIPARNNLGYTRKCLESIQASPPEVSCEIILVDNASNDGTKEFSEEKAAQGELQVIRNDPPQPFAASCNRGAKAARGKYLVFLNNDTEAFPGWLEAMVKCAQNVPDAGAVGAKLIFPEGSIQHAGIAFYYSEKYKRVNPYHVFKEFPRNAPAVSKPREFQAITGACLLTPKGIFDELGGFDERFVNCFEDVDYCLRLRESGYKVLYTPEAELIHYEGKTAGRNDHQVQAGMYL